jgi:hypothetical protein
MGLMNEIIHVFDHLSTQLALIGLTIKVPKCKHWSPLGISPGIEIPQSFILVIDGLCILGALVGSQNFAMHFFDEALFQDMVHIDDFLLLGDA